MQFRFNTIEKFVKNFRVCQKIFNFVKNFQFLKKIQFLTKFPISHKISNFSQNFQFLTKFPISQKISNFSQNFQFLKLLIVLKKSNFLKNLKNVKNSNFDKNFEKIWNFVTNFKFCEKLQISSKIPILYLFCLHFSHFKGSEIVWIYCVKLTMWFGHRG